MKNNNMYSAVLSLLLLVPGQVLYSEPLSPQSQTILGNMWFMPTMPVAPAWVTNFVSSLSDNTQQYLWYGTYGVLGLLLTYIGYRALKRFPTIEGRSLVSPNLNELVCFANANNIKCIISGYSIINGDKQREEWFKEYICPVFEEWQTELDSQEKWQKFLPTIPLYSLGIEMKDNFDVKKMKSEPGNFGLKIFVLLHKSCPNATITDPLKEFLRERTRRYDTGDNQKNILEILNK